jgi:hypothetical protein
VHESGQAGRAGHGPRDEDGGSGDDAPWQPVPSEAAAWYCGPPADRRAYVVEDVTGFEGGQGRVVRAERRTFAGDPVGYEGAVSLKLVTDHRVERVRLTYDRWARLAAIDHPNVARALEAFEGPGLFRTTCPPATDDVLYTAAVWVEGQCLRDVAPLDPREAFGVARDVAAGLAALHAHGLVHRDVHPGNVVVDDWGRAVVIDLGSARPDHGGTTTTVAGTLGFIPPETLHRPGDTASDRWGLGMITVFALLGHPRGDAGRAAIGAELADALAGTAHPGRAIDLLCAMTAADAGERPVDPVAWARDLTACLSRSQRRHARHGGGRADRRRGVQAAAVAAGAVTLAAAALLLGDALVGTSTPGEGDEPVQGPSVDPAAVPDPPCAETRAGQGGASPALAGAVRRLAPDACAGGVAETFGDAEVQPLDDAAGRDDGVVMVTPSGTSVRLTRTMWTSYREIVGKDNATNAVTFGGYPTAIERQTDPDAVVIQLDGGGQVVGRRDDAQMFWLPAQVLDLWTDHGGFAGDLGFPTSNPHFDGGHLELHFEGGFMTAEVADVASLLLGGDVDTAVVLDQDARAEPLAGVDVEEHIVRQFTGTAWWVDDEGVRHWIPDGGTWQCLGGDAAVAVDELEGWAVATLPLGEAATCP